MGCLCFAESSGWSIILIAVVFCVVSLTVMIYYYRPRQRNYELYVGNLPKSKTLSDREESIFHEINDWYIRELSRPVDPVLGHYYLSLCRQREEWDFEKNILPDLQHYKSKVERAQKEIVPEKSIIFAGLLRDNEDRIFGIIDMLQPIITRCKEYKIIILENNSKDKTRERLLRWAKQDPHVIILCHSDEVFNDEQCHLSGTLFEWSRYDDEHTKNAFDKLHQRTYKMSLLRNLLLSTIHKHYSHFDLLFMIDFDLHGSLFADGVFHSLEYIDRHPEIDGIIGSGMNASNTTTLTLADLQEEKFEPTTRYANRIQDVSFFYYDTFAYIDKGGLTTYFFHDAIRRTHHDYVIHYITQKYSKSMDIDPVESAFGGIGIYRTKKALDHTYSIDPNHKLPFMNTGLFTEVETSSLKVECEHTSFHHNMNLVLNPRMVFFILKNP